jgi:hypothetical protein
MFALKYFSIYWLLFFKVVRKKVVYFLFLIDLTIKISINKLL